MLLPGSAVESLRKQDGIADNQSTNRQADPGGLFRCIVNDRLGGTRRGSSYLFKRRGNFRFGCGFAQHFESDHKLLYGKTLQPYKISGDTNCQGERPPHDLEISFVGEMKTKDAIIVDRIPSYVTRC